jgi:lipid-A-disaccharide synthase
MRIAKWAKKQGIKVVYYISPQVWAWKEGRVNDLRRDVDKMLVILPFEVDFYKKWNFPVTYVGHPLVEVVRKAKAEHQPYITKSGKPFIALLPGSRAQEIKLKLPIMLSVVKDFPEYDFVVAAAPSQPDSLYEAIIADTNVQLVKNNTYGLLLGAKAALVTSGTATLETALFGVPQVVCYKGNPISFWLAKRLVKIKYVSLVNLIADKTVVTELLQNNLNYSQVKNELSKILHNKLAIEAMKNEYQQLWHLLGDAHASENAASEIHNLFTN